MAVFFFFFFKFYSNVNGPIENKPALVQAKGTKLSREQNICRFSDLYKRRLASMHIADLSNGVIGCGIDEILI